MEEERHVANAQSLHVRAAHSRGPWGIRALPCPRSPSWVAFFWHEPERSREEETEGDGNEEQEERCSPARCFRR